MPLFPYVYDWVMQPWERRSLGRYRRAVVAPASGFILEIGAGTGLNFPYYQRRALVVATDPDQAMLSHARRRAVTSAAEILFVVADGEALPFRNDTFDEVVVGLAMCTIPRPHQALSEMHRALRPSGILRMLEHVRMDHPAVLGRLQDWLTPLWRRAARGCRLNRRTVQEVPLAGFVGVRATPHVGGYLQEIVAHRGGEP